MVANDQGRLTPGWPHMERALLLAERGRGRTSPNPMVGAVVVSPEGVVEGAGFHARAGLAHAEVVALDAAGARAGGATLYCTLEPCCHVGRTGPCVARIVDAGVRRVEAAMEDPDPRVRGQGFAYLRAHGVEVDVGLGGREALDLNRGFVTTMRHGRPFVIAKAAASVDGRVAARPGQATPLTSEGALRHAHAVRAEVDALAIGSGTLVADDPLLTPRRVHRVRPLTRIVFDRRLRTTASARVFTTLAAGPIVILTAAARADSARARVLVDAGASVEPTDGTFSGALRRLAALGIQSVVLEGGAALHAAAWDARLVDYVQLYVAPLVLGEAGVPVFGGRGVPAGGLTRASITVLGPDILLEGYAAPIDA